MHTFRRIHGPPSSLEIIYNHFRSVNRARRNGAMAKLKQYQQRHNTCCTLSFKAPDIGTISIAKQSLI